MIVAVFAPLENDADSGPILTVQEGSPERLAYLIPNCVEVFEKRDDYDSRFKVVDRKIVPKTDAEIADQERPFAVKAVRRCRDYLLREEVDPIVTNPLRWGDLTDSQKNAFIAYRQALLHITDSENLPDPFNPVWPTKPEI